MEVLKSCPFCGNVNIAVTNKEEGWSIKCLSCYISIDDYVSREAAMEAWNRRPPRLAAGEGDIIMEKRIK